MKKLLVVFILVLIISLATAIPVFALNGDVDGSDDTSASVVTMTEEDSNGWSADKKSSGGYSHGGVCGSAY
ncbi:MAG: hypothetical protein IIC81_01430 [Chloroflexi bacterium]|nr:hypothetical protein [Chloroflexota bacterium]